MAKKSAAAPNGVQSPTKGAKASSKVNKASAEGSRKKAVPSTRIPRIERTGGSASNSTVHMESLGSGVPWDVDNVNKVASTDLDAGESSQDLYCTQLGITG